MMFTGTLRRLQQPSISYRSISFLHRVSATNPAQQEGLDHAIHIVRQFDQVGYLPGRLLPEERMKIAYYATRSFWVETGLRFGTTAKVPANSTPAEHLDWWQNGIGAVFDSKDLEETDWNHPTLLLLQQLVRDGTPWRRESFEGIINGRKKDLDVKQYESLDDLKFHAEQSCGSLAQLVLESGSVLKEQSPSSFEAARLEGVCHGLTNALRTSIPVISTTGKLIVPADLTKKYGVRSPRYLLSALGQGDEECVAALQSAVKDIADFARDNLLQARNLREKILQEPGSDKALAVLLPGLASETFLNRLADHHFKLTDRQLRNVGALEHWSCAWRMIVAYYTRVY
jgi:phytoene/squalene synthetase